MTELEAGKFSITSFYERRARRILPALFFVIGVTYTFAWIWLPSGYFLEYSQSLVSVAVFLSNVFFWSNSGYFDTESELQLLLHTWSLAVEEQFYMLFPLFLMAGWKFGRKAVLALLLGILCTSLFVADYLVRDFPNATFFLLPTRIWELTIGIVAAIFCLNRPVNEKTVIDEALSLLGLLGIIYAIFIFNPGTTVPGIEALVPTLGAVLIIVFAKTGTFVQQLLSIRFIVGIGLISYSLYLWHQPILALARHRLLGDIADITPILLAIVFVAAVFSWYFVERTFRSNRFSKKTVFQLSLGGMLIITTVGWAGHLQQGFPERRISYLSFIEDLALGSYEPDNHKLRVESWQLIRGHAKELNGGTMPETLKDAVWFEAEDPRKKMLFVGNSHSKDLYNIFYHTSASQNYQLGRYGVQIHEISEEFFNHPDLLASDVVVIASLYDQEDLDAMESVVESLVNIDKEVVLVTKMFTFPNYPPFNLADNIVIKSVAKNLGNDTIVDRVNAAYTRVFEEEVDQQPLYVQTKETFKRIVGIYESVKVLDRMDYVCPRGRGCLAMGDDFAKYFYDYGHHTGRGAEVFADVVEEIGLDNIIR
jgi:peptidoglycan/LPS O-acetylase OafA/YrhL